MAKTVLERLRKKVALGERNLALSASEIREQLVGENPQPVSIDVARDLAAPDDPEHPVTLRIIGDLDLRGCRGPDGGPLPPIDLEGVWFLGKLRLGRSTLSRLCLRNCRFKRLDGRDADIASTLDLRGVRALAPEDAAADPQSGGDPTQCAIDLCNARIDGDIRLRDAKLKVGPATGRPSEATPPLYALDLRGAEITGSLRLKTGFEAIGGVTVADASIGGDLHAHGARMIAVHGAALRAQGVKVQGGVFCCAFNEQKFHAEGKDDGGLIFQHAHIGRMNLYGAEVWSGGGTRTDDRPARMALDLSHAVVEGVVTVGNADKDPDSEAAFFEGQVSLRGARIGSDVRFTATRIVATFSDEPRRSVPRYAFDAVGARIEGSVHLEDGFIAKGGVRVADAEIAGDLFLWGATLEAPHRGDALRGRNVAIGGVLRASRLPREMLTHLEDRSGHLVCIGGIALPNASVDLVALNHVKILGRRARLDLQGCRIRGTLSVSIEPPPPPANRLETARPGPAPRSEQPPDGPRIEGPIIVTDARIEGDVILDGLDVSCSADNKWLRSQNALLDMTGIAIEGELRMKSVDGATRGYDPAIGWQNNRRPATDAPDLCLKAAKIGRNLEICSEHLTFISAETARIGGSCQLTLSRRNDSRIDMNNASTAEGFILSGARLAHVLAKGMSIHGHLELCHCDIAGLVQLDRADVGGDLVLENITFLPPSTPWDGIGERPKIDSLYFDGSAVRGRLKVRNVGFNSREATESTSTRSTESPVPHVSLMFLSVRTIDDQAAWAWSPDLRLQLRGLTYDAFAYNPKSPAPYPEAYRTAREEKIRGIQMRRKRQAWKGLATIGTPGLMATIAAYLWLEPAIANYVMAMSVGVFLYGLCTAWEFLDPAKPDKIDSRLKWLTQQYRPQRTGSLHEEYHPQPLLQAARVYRSQGFFEYADAVLTTRLFKEIRVKQMRLFEQQAKGANILSFISRVLDRSLGSSLWLTGRIYYIFYRFGLSAPMALISFVAYWGLGVLLVSWADGHEALVRTKGDEVTREACHVVMRPMVYALDIAVPVLDLGAKDVCVAPPSMPPPETPQGKAPQASGKPFHENWWHKILALYGLGGWVVSSLTILTLTGVFRRLAEN